MTEREISGQKCCSIVITWPFSQFKYTYFFSYLIKEFIFSTNRVLFTKFKNCLSKLNR